MTVVTEGGGGIKAKSRTQVSSLGVKSFSVIIGYSSLEHRMSEKSRLISK